MRSRKRWSSVLGVAAVVTALAVVAAGCGSSKKSSASTTSSSGSGKTFPTLKVVYGDTDYMDPGLSYRVESWQLFQNIYEGLLVQKHGAGAEGAKVVPALAESQPTSNAKGTDYKFTLRKGLKYSNGKPIMASDFP